ncbi:hypothetical protein QFZ83_006410 [Variovorax sp. W1I1]|uniref:GapS1 family protein n=1 Tax=Variovorax sp. W1I1 TaxID=3042309 RepID=UPI00278402F8|nr:hypothetical protein [Variovorax sp. W1I1]MDQ0612239.1 hypothetical protein [Variovorax sp. W1I1]
MANLKAAPWISLLLVKWSLQDRMVHINVGHRIPLSAFNRLRQEVWDLPAAMDGPNEHGNMHAMMRTLLQQQIEFQREPGWGFLRWAALISRRPANDALWQRFRETLGMDPHTYIDLSMALFASTIDGKRTITDRFFAPLRPVYGQSVGKFLDLFVRDLSALRGELQKPVAQEVRGRAELAEFPYLKRYPFVRLAAGELTCWHPLVLARGLEDAVHIRLSDHGEEYTRPFSLIFERYVIELATAAIPDAIPEADYERALGGNAPKVEALIQLDSCNIMVEAKMALFSDSMIVTDNPEKVMYKTKRVRDAISQGWKVSKSLSQETNPYYSGERPENFLLVVTSRQLHLGYGEMLARLYPPGRLAYPDDDAEQRLPLNHIFILSIEEFETLMGSVQAEKVSLSTLLRKAAADNKEPSTAKLYFLDHLRAHGLRKFQPHLIKQAIDDSHLRLASVLGGGAFA